MGNLIVMENHQHLDFSRWNGTYLEFSIALAEPPLETISIIYLELNMTSTNTKKKQKKSEHEVRNTLDKRFNLNYVYDVTQDDIKVTKRGNYLKVQAEYETVVKIFGNLSVLAEFNDIIEVGQE